MSDIKEYLKKNTSLLQKLKGNLRALNQFRAMYNSLCPTCKAQVLKNPRMDISEYCKFCKPDVERRLDRIKKMI
jgi:hypothetical protein